MNHERAAKDILVGLACFVLLLLVCITIRPIGLTVNNGISYYAGYGDTLVPYCLAFLLNGVFIWRAASAIGNKTKIDRYIQLSLRLMAILLFGLLVTPHTIFGGEHRFFGTVLFGLQLAMGMFLVTFIHRDRVNFLLLIVTFFSGIASLVYLILPYGYMLEAQVIFQLSIWAVFVRYLKS